MRGGTHTFLPTERVHFGPGSLDKIEEEARAKDRAFVVTGRSLYEKTDLVRRVETLHAGKLRRGGCPASAGIGPARERRGRERGGWDQGRHARARLPYARRRADDA